MAVKYRTQVLKRESQVLCIFIYARSDDPPTTKSRQHIGTTGDGFAAGWRDGDVEGFA